jgi:hypothetical protein
MPNPRKTAVSGGPYQVTLDLNYQDTDCFVLFARRQYRSLRQATEALPGVKLRKRKVGYAVIFGDRQIGTLAKAAEPTPTVYRSTPRKAMGLRQVYHAAALAVAAIIGRFV